MLKYALKRIALAIPLLLFITILCFSLMELAPYDAVDAMTTPRMPPAQVQAIKEKYGFDMPAPVRYVKWLTNTLKGDLGYSILTHRSIGEDLKVRIFNTMKLMIPSYATALLLAMILGMAAGAYQGKAADKIINGFCSIGIAIPSFWFAMIAIYIFSYKLGLFPVMGMYSVGKVKTIADYLWHFVLPYATLTFAFLPELTRYIRAATIVQLAEPYVKTQKSLGTSWFHIMKKHVAKNVSLPIITKIGMTFPMFITGAVVTESVFGWPGVGPYFVHALQGFDYPVIMAILLISGAFVLIGNLLADLLYSAADPRIHELRGNNG